jgi:hypothetical protein
VEKRRLQRNRRRLTCELVVAGKGYPGIVRDYSPAGVFVQTRARPPVNSVVEVVFRLEGSAREIRSEAGVARERFVPTKLQSSLPGGVALELLDPPAELHALLSEGLARAPREDRTAPDAPAAAAARTFRVRLKEHGRPNSRVVTVRCDSAQAARSRALARLGAGWKVADVQEL